MFTTIKQKIFLGFYIFIVLSIPVTFYLVSESQNPNTKAKETTTLEPITKPIPTKIPENLTSKLESLSNTETDLSNSPTSSAPATMTFGPTMNLKVAFEGRPTSQQSNSMFIGIATGTPATSPKYLLMFNLNIPESGVYNGLSLAGLDVGTQYTAFLKGPASIATSSAFIVTPTVIKLNNDQTLTMLSGDLNEDNTINSADYSIASSAFRATPTSKNWNQNADLNGDEIINTVDLGIITKNFGKVGASGTWTSPVPSVGSTNTESTPSGSLQNNQFTKPPEASVSSPQEGVSPNGESGYWFWVPKL